MAMSNYLKDQFRKHLFRTGSFPKPSVLGVALHTANPTGVPLATEVIGGAYARVAMNPADANWSAVSALDGITTNLVIIHFPTPSAPWGDVTHCSIWDALVAGNMLVYGVLLVPRTISTSTDTKFDPGSLVFIPL